VTAGAPLEVMEAAAEAFRKAKVRRCALQSTAYGNNNASAGCGDLTEQTDLRSCAPLLLLSGRVRRCLHETPEVERTAREAPEVIRANNGA
jgi:hypothetical protein